MDMEEKERFEASSCYCADGFIPYPFEKEKIYKFLYRYLKKAMEHKELLEYIKYLETAQAEEFFPQTSKTIQKEAKEREEKEGDQGLKMKEYIRFNYGSKISASEFMDELDDTVIDKVEEFLNNLDAYFAILDDMYEADAQTARTLINSIVETFTLFSYTVDTLATFPVIVKAFDDLANFLQTLAPQQLQNTEKKEQLIEILRGLGRDLEEWIINIFEKQNVSDIHYLDASFADNVLEFESLFHETAIELDDDDLEFF